MKTQASSKSTSASKPGKGPEGRSGPDAKEQAALFEKAMGAFHKRDFTKAQELFQQAGAGPSREVTHAAEMHRKMCERRLSAAPAPKTPEERYTLGVALMNRGELEAAEKSLREAVKSNDQADHFHYALSLCLGLRGDLEGAARHLERAIEIQPSNRIAARNDADFVGLARQSPLRELLQLDKG